MGIHIKWECICGWEYIQLWDPKKDYGFWLCHRFWNGKSLNSLNFAHNLRVRIFQSNFRSELSGFVNPTKDSGLQTVIFVLIYWAQKISAGKVRIFWDGHKIWKNLPLKIWRYWVASNLCYVMIFMLEWFSWAFAQLIRKS